MRKRSLFVMAGACAAALSLAVGSVAFADPVGPPIPRLHPGTGSDTTQDVMNGFANGVSFSVPAFPGITDAGGNRVLGSFDATGPTPIRYRETGATCQTVNIRPNGSTEGVNALRGNTPPAGPFPQECVDWARSSSNSAPTRAGQELGFIPFARDTVTMATLSSSLLGRNFSTAQLGTIYRLNIGAPLCDNNEANGEFKPVLPQAGSGTRQFFLQRIGVTEAQIGSCVNSTQPAAPQEHDCRTIANNRELLPYGVAQYTTQTAQPQIANRAGGCQLRAVDGRYGSDPAHPMARDVYNVMKRENIPVANGGTGTAVLPELVQAFVGATSDVCSNPQVIIAYGFRTIANCGVPIFTAP